jgi:putative FmdB family regulatory protein
MPIYEFKCSECEEFFEIIVMSSNDENLKGCPKCGSSAFDRVISKSNYVMAGSGACGTATRQQGVHTQERNCSSGSCTTYTIPGETA